MTEKFKKLLEEGRRLNSLEPKRTPEEQAEIDEGLLEFHERMQLGMRDIEMHYPKGYKKDSNDQNNPAAE